METLIHSLTIESSLPPRGPGPVGDASSSLTVRVDDPNDLPPTFGAVEEVVRREGEVASGSGRVGGLSGSGGVAAADGGIETGAPPGDGDAGMVLPPSYAGDGMEGGTEEPPVYS